MITDSPTLITFVIYLISMMLIGWLGYRATSNLSDYILGGRSLGSVVTALSAGASDMSGWLLLGLPGALYVSGVSEGWIAVGLVVGAWLNWRYVAAKLRLYTEKCGNSLTLPDYLSNRFEDHSHALRLVTAVVILLFFTLYCASGVVASARLFENLFGMDYTTALWIGAVATIAYVFIGGFLAVSWTDTIQASLMITALIVVPLMVIYSSGGVSSSVDLVARISPEHLSIFRNMDAVALISLLAWGLGYFGQPHVLVRFMAAESVHTIPNARRISMAWMIFCLLGACAVGFFGFAWFASNPMTAAIKANPETVFVELSKLLFNPWLAGLFLASILAAVMSTLSCQLLVCSSALTEDIYKTFLRKQASQKELVWFGRAMVLLVAIIAIILATDPDNQILKMVSYAWAGFGAAFGPVIILSLYWKRMTRNGALAGIITGALTVLIWKQFGWLGLYEIVPGFILATMAAIGVSLIGNAPAASIQQLHDEVEAGMPSKA
jgi:sodium/proline symporter